jgi:iron complex outermembrane receptor protein
LVVYWADWANGTAPGFTPNAAGTTGGVATNTTPLITQRKDDRDDRVNAIGWNNELKIDKWTATGDLSYSRATRHEFIGEVYATSTNPVDATVHFPSDFSGFGSLSSSYDFSNPANFALSTAWWGGGGAVSVVDVKDKMNSLRLSAKRDLDWGAVSAFDGGIVYSDRSKDMNKVSTNYNLPVHRFLAAFCNRQLAWVS